MVKRQHATSSQPSLQFSSSLCLPGPPPLKPRGAFPMTSGYTRVIPLQWQNPLPTDQLNSHSRAHKMKSQMQHKTWVTPHAGHLAQMRGRQDINTAPQRSQCHITNVPGPEQRQGSKMTTSCVFPSGCPRQLRCVSDYWAESRLPWQRLPGTAFLWPEKAYTLSDAVLPDLYHTTTAQVSIL